MIWLLPTLLIGAEIPENGTLIVTYQTNNKGERIERVRFWLKNENAKQTLYPRGTAFVDDKHKKTRMVVIEDLHPGQYTIEFLVPNLDGRFEAVPERKVKITRGEVVKIDQEIKTRKGYWSNRPKPLKRSSAPDKELTAMAEAPKETPPVNVQAPKETAPAKKEELKEEPKPTAADKDLNIQEPPISPKPVEEPETEEPPKVEEEINLTFGKLIVSYELREDPALAGSVRFRLNSNERETTVHPKQGSDTEIPLHAGKMVMIQNLPSGPYEIEFFLEGEENVLAKKSFEIKENLTKSVHQSLKAPKGNQEVPVAEKMPKPSTPPVKKSEEVLPSVILSANIPTAEFELVNRETGKKYKRKGREVSFDSLPAGKYELYLNSYDPYFIPPAKELLEIADGKPVIKEVTYITLGKVKISTNVPQATAYITPMEHNHPAYKKEVVGGEVTVYLPEGKYRITFNPIKGKKIPEPVDINVRSLESEQLNVYFSVG